LDGRRESLAIVPIAEDAGLASGCVKWSVNGLCSLTGFRKRGFQTRAIIRKVSAELS
jgi:hypothetical protein